MKFDYLPPSDGRQHNCPRSASDEIQDPGVTNMEASKNAVLCEHLCDFSPLFKFLAYYLFAA